MPKTSARSARAKTKTGDAAQPLQKAEGAAVPHAPLPPELRGVREQQHRRPIPSAFRLLGEALQVLQRHWRILLAIALIYAGLNVLLVQGLNASSNLTIAKRSLDVVPSQGIGRLGDGISLYTYLLGASGSSVAPTAGAYQFVLALVMSLAIIWSLRQLYAGRDIMLREGFYYGMYPFVTFFLVLMMVVVHLLPFALGASVYSIIAANGLAVGGPQQLIFLLLFLGLTAVSLYLLCSSLVALYIVTLPGVSPMTALRSARDLVAGRRWTIMRKLAFLPLALLALAGVVLVPVVLLATGLAPWIFTAVAAVMLVLTHGYMYALYRSLL